MHLFGVHLLGFDAENGKKLLLTCLLVTLVLLGRFGLIALFRTVLHRHPKDRVVFWTRQVANVLATLLILVLVLSIWFEDPKRWATAAGLVSAGLAFALQKVVTAVAGYVVILRGKTFSVGDRITMGGVRGDVIALGFIQTTILEMGQPASVQSQAEPAMWVHSRQFTGRIVTVTNDKIFDEPVFNYSRVFPFLWEEMHVPISYRDDRERAEKILLECAARTTKDLQRSSRDELAALEKKFGVAVEETTPRVFWRITDNWLELTVRFIVPTHGVRVVKDAMSRAILRAFDEAGIGIASSTYDIVGVPPLRIEMARDGAPRMAHVTAERDGSRTAPRRR